MGKVKTVRPATLYGLTNRQQAELEVAGLKMLRLFLGVTRIDGIENENI